MGPFIVRKDALTPEQIDELIHSPACAIVQADPHAVQAIQVADGVFDDMERMQTEAGGPYLVLVAPQAAEMARKHFGGTLPKWIRVVEQLPVTPC